MTTTMEPRTRLRTPAALLADRAGDPAVISGRSTTASGGHLARCTDQVRHSPTP